jgi:hypothetical protein
MPAMAATTVLERASLRVLDHRCTEPPGAPGYYAAFVLDPDGNNLEAVCMEAR